MELLAVPEGDLTSRLQVPHRVRVADTPWAVRLVAGTLRKVDTTHRHRSRRTVACRQAVVATTAMRLPNQCISSVHNKTVVM